MVRVFPYFVKGARILTEFLFGNILNKRYMIIFVWILEGYFLEAYIGLVISVLLNLFFMVKVGGKMVQGKENTVTEEEIRQMVDAGGDNGSIDENEK